MAANVHNISGIRAIAAAAILGITVGCGEWIFSDTFDGDPVGAPPTNPPPGDPADDALAYTGVLTVVNSAIVGSNAARMDRGSTPTATVFDLVAGGGANNAGQYRIRWRAYAEAHLANLTISLRSASGRVAFRITFLNGQYRLVSGSGTEVIGGAVTLNAAHQYDITVDMGARTVAVTRDATTLPARPFLDSTFEGVRMLRLEYPASLLEAIPGLYVIDWASIKRL